MHNKEKPSNTRAGHSTNSGSHLPVFRGANLQGLMDRRVNVNPSLPYCMVHRDHVEEIQEKPMGWDTQGGLLTGSTTVKEGCGSEYRKISG